MVEFGFAPSEDPFVVQHLARTYYSIGRFPGEVTDLKRKVSDDCARAYQKAIGPGRVLMGTDYPFPMGDQDLVGRIRSTPGLDTDEIRSITSDNARSIFG